MTFVGLFFGIALMAAPITQDVARQKALQFLSGRSGNVAAARGMQQVKLQLKEGVVTDQLYVFNVGQHEGFVIVSGDDCTGDLVLGYADKGEISAENMPDNLRSWLQGYADQIQWMKEHGVRSQSVAASRGAMKKTKAAIPAMLTTQWNQGAPYNANCPKYAKLISGNTYSSESTVTGCVATATAQVMNYQAKKHGIHQTPTTQVIPQYSSTKCLLWNETMTGVWNAVDKKPITTINWDAMSNTYPSTEQANDAVATLMEYIGAAVEMQYGTSDMGGSSASQEAATSALVSYFGYDPDARSIYRNKYSYDEWVDAIYTELSTNGPVLYSGQSASGGHAFVVDGYDHDDYFYVNWGWGGMSDGSFRLSLLNPDDQGIGGGNPGDGYNSDQMAMINVCPVDDGVNLRDEASLTVNEWSCTISSYASYGLYYGELRGNTVYTPQINYSFINDTGWSLDFEWGVAIYQNSSLVNVVYGPISQSFPSRMNRYGTTASFNWGNSLANGEYQMVAVSRKVGTSTWHKCIDSDKYYVKMIVSSPTTALQNYPAIEIYNADGTQQVIDIAASVTVPSNALAVDLSLADGVTSVTPNSNPNTLYFVGSSVPSGLTGKNVVQNGTAATLTLTDGQGFYAPKQFTATKATYTRQFTTAANGTGGWSTIVVPFNVSTVKQGSKVIDWFHSGSDTGKNFWLKEFSSESGNTVNFGYATQMAANTPYIIAVPGNSYGATWDLTNKDITFEGSSVQVLPSTGTATMRSKFRFVGSLPGTSVTNRYVLNAAGTQFVNSSTTVDPFRAYFEAVGLSSLGALIIGSEDDGATGIGISLMNNEEGIVNGEVLDLQGRRVAQPKKGLYIKDGKKVIIK